MIFSRKRWMNWWHNMKSWQWSSVPVPLMILAPLPWCKPSTFDGQHYVFQLIWTTRYSIAKTFISHQLQLLRVRNTTSTGVRCEAHDILAQTSWKQNSVHCAWYLICVATIRWVWEKNWTWHHFSQKNSSRNNMWGTVMLQGTTPGICYQ